MQASHRSLFFLAAISILAPAQESFVPVRISFDEEGLYFLSFEQLAPHLNLTTPLDHVGLFDGDKEIPIEIRGGRDRRLDPGDGIIFYGQRRAQGHTKETTYCLRLSSQPRRIRRLTRTRAPETVDEVWREMVFEEDRLFEPIPTVVQSVVRDPKTVGIWVWHDLAAPRSSMDSRPPGDSSATLLAEIYPSPRRNLPAILEVDVFGPPVEGVPQRLELNVNGKDIPAATWDKGLAQTLSFQLPAGLLDRRNTLQFRNASAEGTYKEPGNEIAQQRQNRMLIDRVRLRFTTLLMGSSRPDEQTQYRLLPRNLKSGQTLRFDRIHRDGFLLYDVDTATYQPHGEVPALSDRPMTLVCCSPGGFRSVKSVAPLRRTDVHISGEGGDYVVITTTRLRPFLTPLLEHRIARGLKPIVVEARELYDTFTAGAFSPEAITRFMKAAWNNWKTKPKYLLLVGDADHDVDWISVKETLPTRLVMTDYNGATATDNLFGDVNGDGLPEIAVGRIPARTPEALVDYSKRIIELETKPEPGLWRRRVNFVAGEGRFKPEVDALLERVATNILTREIPAGYRVSMTYGKASSPFYWPAASFNDRVVGQLNEGCLALTYIGHGSPEAFDSLRVGRQRFSILDKKDVERIDAGGRPAVLTVIACWTGEFDHPTRDCIAETLLFKNGGPAAVVAASRISHPFPNALLGRALAKEMFAARRPFGEVVRSSLVSLPEARTGLLGALAMPFLSEALDPALLVKDHVYLYNLLGDPALELPVPAGEIVLRTPDGAAAGRPLKIEGTLPKGGAGEVFLALERPLRRVPAHTAPADPQAPGAEPLIVQNNRRANDPTLAQATLTVEGGSFTTELLLPHGLAADTYNLTAYLVSKDGNDAMGSLEIKLMAP